MKILIRAITPKRAKILDPQAVERELRGVLNNEVKPDLLADFRSTSATWKTRVDFKGQTRISPNEIAMTVTPTGAGAKIWGYVNDGTRPHLIRPKRGRGVLAFQKGYRAKTRPGRITAGVGGSFGAVAFAKAVHHPGTEGRDFTGQIAGEYKPTFKRLADAGLRRAVKR